MALPISSIPELTGEVAQRFEAEAEKNFQRQLNRTEKQRKTEEKALEKGFARLRRILAKAKLGSL